MPCTHAKWLQYVIQPSRHGGELVLSRWLCVQSTPGHLLNHYSVCRPAYMSCTSTLRGRGKGTFRHNVTCLPIQWCHMVVGASQIEKSAQQFTQSNTKYDIKDPHNWPFVRGIHRWPVDSPHKGAVTRKKFPRHDIIVFFSGMYECIPPHWNGTGSWNSCHRSPWSLTRTTNQGFTKRKWSQKMPDTHYDLVG